MGISAQLTVNAVDIEQKVPVACWNDLFFSGMHDALPTYPNDLPRVAQSFDQLGAEYYATQLTIQYQPITHCTAVSLGCITHDHTRSHRDERSFQRRTLSRMSL